MGACCQSGGSAIDKEPIEIGFPVFSLPGLLPSQGIPSPCQQDSSPDQEVARSSVPRKKVSISHEENEDGVLIPIIGDDEEGQANFADFASESSQTLSHSSLGRCITFQIMNLEEKDDLNPSNSIDRAELSRAISFERYSIDWAGLDALKVSNPEGYKEEVERIKDQALKMVEDLVDRAYDILPAESLLEEVEKLITKERFLLEVVTTDLFERFARKLDYFYDVGISCSQSQENWLEVYSADDGRQSIHGLIDTSDASVLHYAARMEIPTSMTNVLAVANEIQLMQKWNSLVVKEPEVIGQRTGHYMVLNYQMSALGGMYKVDVLNEIRRFTDRDGGFLVEYVSSVKKDHPSYSEPLKGHKRLQTLLKNVIFACGPNCTVILQMGKLKLPFSATKWLAKTLGGIAGRFIIGGLVANSMKAAETGSPWKDLIKEDRFGFYHRLNECIDSDTSKSRDPANSANGRAANTEVRKCFDGRRFAGANERVRNGRKPSCQY